MVERSIGNAEVPSSTLGRGCFFKVVTIQKVYIFASILDIMDVQLRQKRMKKAEDLFSKWHEAAQRKMKEAFVSNPALLSMFCYTTHRPKNYGGSFWDYPINSSYPISREDGQFNLEVYAGDRAEGRKMEVLDNSGKGYSFEEIVRRVIDHTIPKREISGFSRGRWSYSRNHLIHHIKDKSGINLKRNKTIQSPTHSSYSPQAATPN